MGIGICVAYFDFLTWPTAAFCVPAGLVLMQEKEDWKRALKRTVGLGMCWGIGYFGMWCGKWVLGTVFLDSNLFVEALGRAGVHTGEVIVEGETYGLPGVLWRNVRLLLRWPYLLCGVGLLLFYIKKTGLRFHSSMLKQCLPFVLLFLIPPCWLMLLKSHSAWCYWYTYRNLAGSAFLVGLILRLFAGEKEGIKKSRP